jgi:threonine dehydratase
MAQPSSRVRPIELEEITAARERIAGTILRTPLVELDLGLGFPNVRLKLENLQPTNSYKIRGAANAVALLANDARRHGVWTISAGNAGQGIAYAARAAGIPCTVVAIESAPAAKIDRMRTLGANLVLVPYAKAWEALERREFPGMNGTFIHPFDDHNFIAGHATLGLEILEEAPDATVVITAIGGGGLITGVGSAIKALQPDIRVLGVEPDTAAPAKRSFETGSPQRFPEWTASMVDGAGGMSLLPTMWERMRPVVDDCCVVTVDDVRAAIRLIAQKARVIAEGAGALSVAAAMTGQAGGGPIVAVISGGNIDLPAFSACVLGADNSN